MNEDVYSLMYQCEESHWWYAARRRIIFSVAGVLLTARAASGSLRILDYGCGTGLNLVHLSRFGEVFGIDASPDAIKFCCKRGIEPDRLNSCQEEIPRGNPFGHPFDLVAMLDVLEHMPNDVAALRAIAGWLKPGGHVLVTVPAYDLLWSGEDFVSHHLRRYTRRSLQHVFREASLDVVKMSYFNFFLLPLQIGAVFWRRLFVPRSLYSTSIRPAKPTLNTLLTRIMGLEARIVRHVNLPAGGSILAVGRHRP